MRKLLLCIAQSTLCIALLFVYQSSAAAPVEHESALTHSQTVSTFSIVAIDPQNGDLGVAVASRYFSVGSVVPWGMAGVGAVATQANVNVGYGPLLP